MTQKVVFCFNIRVKGDDDRMRMCVASVPWKL